MPVDPQIQALLDKGTGVPETHTLTVEAARAQYEARVGLMAPAAAIGGVRERTGAGGRRGAMTLARFRCWCSFTAAALCCAA